VVIIFSVFAFTFVLCNRKYTYLFIYNIKTMSVTIRVEAFDLWSSLFLTLGV